MGNVYCVIVCVRILLVQRDMLTCHVISYLCICMCLSYVRVATDSRLEAVYGCGRRTEATAAAAVPSRKPARNAEQIRR